MIHHGDVRTILPTLKAGSVQCVMTSPPYWGLRSYLAEGHDQKAEELGLEPTPEAYVENMVQVFREVKRVLRDDGTCWINLGDSYATSLFTRQGEPRKVCQPPNDWAGTDLGERGRSTHVKVTQQSAPGLKPKDLVGIPWRVAFALQADGWYLRSDIIWAKPNPMPESVTDRPTKAHEYLFLLTKQARYYYDADAIREPYAAKTLTHRGGGRAAGKLGQQDKLGKVASGNFGKWNKARVVDSRGANARSVWTINSQPYAEAHFATFPEKLVEPCVKAGTKHGDTVLDPFVGSGTTGLVAGKLGREFIGIELNADYITLAQNRIEGPLFATLHDSR
jgi:DNA modification methylase